MPKTIIADTSCLIILINIGELGLLQRLYGQIITTLEVEDEYGEKLPDWIEIKAPADKSRQKSLIFL
jgi:predicted nucleic acid-binding protein